MKKIRKGKKILLILLAVVVAALVIWGIVSIVKNVNEPEEPETNIVVQLPETTYSDMEVKNIVMEYLRDQNKTMVSMEFHNTTQNKIENDHFTAMLIGENENLLGQLPTWIDVLDVGEQYKVEVILSGDLTATKQVKLVKE